MYGGGYGLLFIRPINAQITHSIDWFEKMDPFILFNANGSQQRTQTCFNGNKRPYWSDQLEFNVGQNDVVTFQIFDHNTFERNQIVANGEIKVSEVVAMGGSEQTQVPIYHHGHPSGVLNVVLQYKSTTGGSYPQQQGLQQGFQQPGYQQGGFQQQGGYQQGGFQQQGVYQQGGYPQQQGYGQQGGYQQGGFQQQGGYPQPQTTTTTVIQGQPGFGQQGFGQPGYGQPGFGQPGFVHQPGVQVTYQQQGYTQPGQTTVVEEIIYENQGGHHHHHHHRDDW